MSIKYKLPWLRQLYNAPAATEADYRYKPLPSADWIRLLKLKPGKGPEELECELEMWRINLLPAYEALSYSMDLATIPFPLDIFYASICSSSLTPNCDSVG
jgi:hypothetical protein